MPMISVVSIEATSMIRGLEDAAKNLDGSGVETVLEFSAVSRLDASSLQALQEFASLANEKRSKVIIRGLNVEVYKALKLAKLTRVFSFLD